MNTVPFQPLQPKGESMDMEFTVDTDHRKRRRNRTTQSCLNCHTSKRKCDRKRPCQRCIQLGLTGLCVYEIDDPALRDDPTIDETTRLRNRIAELESLVRELRGKPHPRWADSSFRDGDPNEKWHSRATKCAPLKRRHSPDPTGGDRANPNAARAILPSLLTPIKTETANETPSHLYRFSPSPSSRYHQSFSGGGSYEGGASYSDGGGSGNGDYESRSYSSETINCSCRGQHSYATLAHHLDTSLASLRQYSPHPSNTQCAIYRRITELRNMLQANETSESGPSYDSNTPTDSEILTPLSASGSSHGPFHTSASPSSPHEWTTPGYNPYFPMQASEHGSIYNHIIT